MAYEVLTGIKIKKKEFIAGDTINKSDIPKESLEWLVGQKIIVEITKAYKEKKLQESVNVKVEDTDTEFEEE